MIAGEEHEDKRTRGTSDCESRCVSNVWSGARAFMPHDSLNGRQSGLMTNGVMKREGGGRWKNAQRQTNKNEGWGQGARGRK